MSKTPADRDQNLLYGLLAVQLRLVSPGQFVDAVEQWIHAPGQGLPEHLAAAGRVPPKEQELLHSLVAQIVSRHGDDATLSLASFDGAKQVSHLLQRASSGEASEHLTETLGLPRDSVELGLEELAAVEEVPGRYSRTNEYSRGGMGRIMLVHDEYLGRDIALKELLPSGDASDTMLGALSPAPGGSSSLRRFLREARLTGQLEHPSIVPVYELGRSEQGHFYYTMKLVRGKTLSQVLKAGAPLEKRLRYLPHFLDLCHAIAYAHSRGVIHRDIKPANVMVGSFGETVVIDWGLAKVKGKEDIHEESLRLGKQPPSGGLGQDSTATAAGTPIGTPVYMPPEQAEGRVEDIDERSDVYSLGAVLYVLLTGKSPFGGGSPQDVIRQVLEEEPPPVCSIEPRIPAELAGICRKAMQKDPDARYQSARELAEEIGRYQSGSLVHSYDYSLREMLLRFYGSHTALVNAIGVFLVLLAALGSFAYTSIYQARNRERDQRIAAEQAQRVAVSARHEEQLAREAAEHEAYVAQIRLAQSYADASDPSLARATLWATNDTLRNWEWGFLLNRSCPELLTIPDSRLAQFSPDGTYITTTARTGTPTIRRAQTGEALSVISEAASFHLAFSPSGQRLAAACGGGEGGIWSVPDAKRLASLKGHTGRILRTSFSPDGEIVLTTAEDKTVRLWEGRTGEELAVLAGHSGVVRHTAFSPGGARLATVTHDDGTWIWDLATNTRQLQLHGWSPTFSPDGAAIVTNDGAVVFMWDSRTGTEISRFSYKEAAVVGTRFRTPHSELLAAFANGVMQLWDVTTGEMLRSFDHGKRISSFGCSADGSLVATCGPDASLRIWDANTGELLREMRAHSGQVNSLSFSPNGDRLVTSGLDDAARVWNCRNSLARPLTIGTDGKVTALAASPDGKRFMIGSGEGAARLFDAHTGSEIGGFAAFSQFGCSCGAFSPDGERLVVALDRFTPLVWDLRTAAIVSAFVGHEGYVRDVSFSPDGDRIVSGSWDGTARVWDPDTGAELLCLSGHSRPVVGVAYSPSGDRIASASHDGTARIWDARTGDELSSLEDHAAAVVAIRFSPDGKRLVTASEDHTARVWDTKTGDVLLVLSGHRGRLCSAGFAPDAERILTASLDGSARIWDARTGDMLAQICGNGRASCGALFLEHGARILTGGRYNRASLWEAAPWTLESPSEPPLPDWQEQYAHYRAQAQEREAPSLSPPPRLAIATTDVIALRALARLKHALENDPELEREAEAEGVLLREGPVHDAVARFCLLTGDRLLRLNDNPTPSAVSAIEAIDSYLQECNQGHAAPLAMVISRKGRPIPLQFQFREPVIIERTISLSPEEAIGLLRFEQEMLEQDLQLITGKSQRAAAYLGEPPQTATAVNGLWVLDTGDAVKRAFYLRLGLAAGDRVVQFDGAPVRDILRLKQRYEEIAQRVEAERTYTLTQQIERGGFQQITFVIQVKGSG